MISFLSAMTLSPERKWIVRSHVIGERNECQRVIWVENLKGVDLGGLGLLQMISFLSARTLSPKRVDYEIPRRLEKRISVSG